MRKALLLIILVLLSLPLLAGEWTQYYFRFELLDKSQLRELTNVISIDNVKGNWVYAYANDSEWERFSTLGYRAQILPDPASEFPAIMASSLSELRDWDAYPTYDAYVSMMYAFASNYPSLCQIVDAGNTVNGRKILFARISDNVGTHEAEPEVMYSGTIHGDELTGYMLLLRLIDTMLSQYGTDPRITNIVNNLDLWICPNTNPDGTYYGGNSTVASARRYNYNGYDLNRNYPNADGSLNTGALQTETIAMMALSNAHHFVHGANFHGGSEVVNYPWDYTYTLHPDNSWYISSSLVYASSVQANGPSGYFTDINANGITNGAAWYVIAGGHQDWVNYTAKGREVTIECSLTKLPAASTMPSFWSYNYDAMLDYLEQALYGVHGIVEDVYGNPLDATITVVGHDNSYSSIATDPANGDFYRYLAPGSYSLLVETAGYPPQTVPVTVVANQKTPVNITFGELPNEQQITLNAGWNLISINVVPASYLVEDVFQGISGLLQVKNTTHSYAPAMADHFNTLTTLAPGEGYWVNVSSGTTLTIAGPNVDQATVPINLNAGWNLVSYLRDSTLPVSVALTSINANLQEVRHTGSGTVTQMEPGKAYWVKVSQPCILTYP
jgi:hypothetical protein